MKISIILSIAKSPAIFDLTPKVRHHSLEEKLRAIELYDRGYGSTSIDKLLSVDKSQVLRWIRCYREDGTERLNKQSYTHSNAEFKCEVVRQVLEKYLSCDQVALQYEISRSAVGSWVRKVKARDYDALSQTKSRGRPPKTMGRPLKKEPQTELEKREILCPGTINDLCTLINSSISRNTMSGVVSITRLIPSTGSLYTDKSIFPMRLQN